MFVFDFDSTVVSVEALDELFVRSMASAPDRLVRIKEFQEMTDLGMVGSISTEDSLARHLAVLKANRHMVVQVGAEVARYLSPSVERHIEFFESHADRICDHRHRPGLRRSIGLGVAIHP